jgi:hypothetical protein
MDMEMEAIGILPQHAIVLLLIMEAIMDRFLWVV